MWAALVLLAMVAIPLTIEATRKGISDKARRTASGKFALLSQGRTHYQWLGPKDGPVVLCIHGLSTASYVWRGIAGGLALMGYRVLVYDHYGRGLSDTAAGRQDAKFFLRQIDDLLVHEGVDGPLVVLGYSMGGAIAAHFATVSPSRVKQLILLAPAGMHDMSGGRLGIARDWPVIGDWLFLLVYPFILRRGIAAEAGLHTHVEGINSLQQAETDRRGYFPAILSSLRGVLRKRTGAQHKVIAAAQVPVLAVWGDADDVIPVACMDRLTHWNPQAQHAVIAGAGHGLPYTHTDEVLAAIRGVLD